MDRSTYLIKKARIEAAFNMSDYIAAIEEAFLLYGSGGVQMPAKVYLSFDKGDLRCMPAYIPSMGVAGIKDVNVHPLNKDLPTVMATITLVDPETGFPLAVMDGTHITKMRTGAAGGVAAKYLSRQDSRAAAFIGAGTQARTQLQALLITRPAISSIVVYDSSEANMKDFGEHVYAGHALKVEYAASVEEAVRNADIVVTTTPVRSPIVKAEFIRPGTHINAIGADAEGKQELYPAILKRARVVIDNWQQASRSGEINVALSQGIITKDDIYADIGEIVTGKKPARDSDEQITIFDSTGLAIQDISAAAKIYRKLTSDRRLEPQLDKIDFF